MTIPHHILHEARRADRPIYVYDLAVLRERLARLERLPIASKRIHFASMANDHPQILAEIGTAGHGVFVNSPAHLALALGAGVPASRIIFASSNMTRHEMETCLTNGIHAILDSPDQVAAFDALAPAGTTIGIRVNVGSATEAEHLDNEASYRFGLLPEDIADVLAGLRNLRIVGVHSYFGTDIMEPGVLLAGLERLVLTAEHLPDLAYVDSGGGFGIADDLAALPFDLETWGRGAASIMAGLEARVGRSIALVIEPGRWLAAPIGWFFTRIVDVKLRSDRIFAGSTASVAQFPRLLVYPERARHPCENLDAAGRAKAPHPIWISGNSTYSRDFLARGIELPLPVPGDLIVFHHAGAYCRSMLTRFLGKDQPEEIILDTAAERAKDAAALIEAAE